MRLYKNMTDDQKLDLIADLIDPIMAICQNEQVAAAYSKRENPIDCVAPAIKENKEAVKAILAAFEGVPVEEYKVNPFHIPFRCLEILGEDDLQSLFTSQGQTGDATSFGSASVSTGENKQ